MKTFNNEDYILENFRIHDKKNVVYIGKFFKCNKIFRLLKSYKFNKQWVNSSGKNDPPPDFYNNKSKLMMDVMTVEDNSYKNQKGKIVNLTKEQEEKTLRKYFGANYKNERDDLRISVVAHSGLSTIEDHNFDRYVKNFKRVVEKHIDKLNLYKKNHPNFKIIFFIFDESTAYIESLEKQEKNFKQGQRMCGRPHIYFCDRQFVNIFKDSKIDYIVWYAPWKMILNEFGQPFKFPQCAVIDVKNIKDRILVDYENDRMVSSEV